MVCHDIFYGPFYNNHVTLFETHMIEVHLPNFIIFDITSKQSI